MELRKYQQQIVSEISKAVFIEGHKRVLVYAPTGSGKTVIARHIISGLISAKKTVLFTVPRRKLVFQTIDKFGFGNIIAGDSTQDNGSLCTVATLQSLLVRKIDTQFDFIIIDEAHFADDSEYMNYIKSANPNAVFIALSATPIDQYGYLIDGYDKLINVIDEAGLIEHGFLCPVEVFTSKVQPDLSEVEVVNGDYNQIQAQKPMKKSEVIHNIISEYKRLAAGKKTVVFACNIDHAIELETAFKEFTTVGAVHSRMSEAEIEQVFDDFDKNRIRMLINVDMATFGFDQPDIDCLLFARPVKSLRLYKQMIGRGLRIAQNKTKCIILDCANVIKDNGYPTDPIRFEKRPLISKRVDTALKIERDVSGKVITKGLTAQRIEYLQRISSLMDLYADKIYTRESDLVDDVRTFLKKTGNFFWRQNSGTANMDGRWVQFTDKKGLPDITYIFEGVYVGIECKLDKGTLTTHQKQTLPEMISKGVLVFICKSVVDLFEITEHLNSNVQRVDGDMLIKKTIYEMPERQKEYRQKYKLL